MKLYGGGHSFRQKSPDINFLASLQEQILAALGVSHVR